MKKINRCYAFVREDGTVKSSLRTTLKPTEDGPPGAIEITEEQFADIHKKEYKNGLFVDIIIEEIPEVEYDVQTMSNSDCFKIIFQKLGLKVKE